MFLVWGNKTAVMDLGAHGQQRCAVCDGERPFRLTVHYQVHHLYYIFKWVTGKKYMLVCAACRCGHDLSTQEVETQLKRNPIPPFDRFGWVLLAGLIGLVALFATVGSISRGRHVKEMLAKPQPGDLYLVDMAGAMNTGQHSYGLMRVRKVVGDEVELRVASVGYSRSTTAQKDMDNPAKFNSAGYFQERTITRPLAALQEWAETDAIENIRRN